MAIRPYVRDTPSTAKPTGFPWWIRSLKYSLKFSRARGAIGERARPREVDRKNCHMRGEARRGEMSISLNGWWRPRKNRRRNAARR